VRLTHCYDIWIDRSESYPRGRLREVWIQWRRIGLINTGGVVLRGLALHLVVRLDHQSTVDHRSLWIGYAQSIARAWNAVLIGSILTGLRLDTPPLILADALSERGEHVQSDQLHQWFDGRGVPLYTTPGHTPYPDPVPPPDGYPACLLV
jgi:hypothetical protein